MHAMGAPRRKAPQAPSGGRSEDSSMMVTSDGRAQRTSNTQMVLTDWCQKVSHTGCLQGMEAVAEKHIYIYGETIWCRVAGPWDPPPAKGEGSLPPAPPLWYCGTSRVSWQSSRQNMFPNKLDVTSNNNSSIVTPHPPCGVVWGGFGLVVVLVVSVTSSNSSGS